MRYLFKGDSDEHVANFAENILIYNLSANTLYEIILGIKYTNEITEKRFIVATEKQKT